MRQLLWRTVSRTPSRGSQPQGLQPAEQNRLPGVVAQQAEHAAATGAQNLSRLREERLQERAELHAADLVVLGVVTFLPAAFSRRQQPGCVATISFPGWRQLEVPVDDCVA